MELMTILAAAGYDLIFLETVGVGQSEHVAWQFTDGFVLVLQPGAGDELQGIKRGITELADLVIVNKADGNLEPLVKMAKSQYETALHYFSSSRPGWNPKVLTCSSITPEGAQEAWQGICLYLEYLASNETIRGSRIRQKLNWLQWSLSVAAQHMLMYHPSISQQMENGNLSIQTKPDSAFQVAYEIENHMQALLHPSSINSNPA